MVELFYTDFNNLLTNCYTKYIYIYTVYIYVFFMTYIRYVVSASPCLGFAF